MSAILQRVRDAGGTISLAGEHLRLSIPAQLSDELMPEIVADKPGIRRILKDEAGDGWDAGDWRGFRDERAETARTLGGLSPAEAHARAHECCVVEWLNRNPVRSEPGICIGCGGPEQAYDPLLPFGTASAGHAWLHDRCWEEWNDRRRKRAADALVGMGMSATTRTATFRIGSGPAQGPARRNSGCASAG